MLFGCCLVVMRDEKRLISMTKEQNRSSPVLLQCVDKNAAATLLFHVKHNLRANMLGAHSGEERAKGRFV